MEELEKLGHFEETIAVEPSSKLAESCRLKNLTVQEELAENLELESLADVITNFELVEHLYCPMDFLKHCSAYLNRAALLILTTPNALGLTYWF
ncbi:MAG: hypothetical protein IPL73_13975 [Candidatus Obscuribacter sp.]|nr:hypothetical protein [Candidatus Obscuribacter sp.]